MLFTTPAFFCVFLPLTLAGFFLAGRFSHIAAATWLFFASLGFYGYWMPEAIWLLLASICFNYVVGLRIAAATRCDSPSGRWWMAMGVAADLALLGYFKYFNFFVDNLSAVLDTQWNVSRVILPIGISFFTFTQIAFLVDTYRARASEYKLVNYGLFVSYFPHLIAGPVLHHRQMMPQFADSAIYRINGAQLSAGLAIFSIGLLKKVVLADGVSPYADAVFNPADAGLAPDALEAWLAALAYTFQIYFDFSGYSDMAIGLSWMFNVRLPFNFDSPYRSRSISEFWRRWHISLSNFLRDYLYIALGGNRRGAVRRYLNLATTMLLGGLWHGANWSFVWWGGLHGLYLMINHGFRAVRGAPVQRSTCGRWLVDAAGWLLTIFSVIVAWVFFRAESLSGAVRVLESMVGLHPSGDVHPLLWNAGLHWPTGMLWCALLTIVSLLPVNSNRIGTFLLDRCRAHAAAAAMVGGAAIAVALLLVLLNASRDSISAFIYFNF